MKLMEAHKVKAPLAESVTDRPLIKEEDNANCADNVKILEMVNR